VSLYNTKKFLTGYFDESLYELGKRNIPNYYFFHTYHTFVSGKSIQIVYLSGDLWRDTSTKWRKEKK